MKEEIKNTDENGCTRFSVILKALSLAEDDPAFEVVEIYDESNDEKRVCIEVG